MMTMKLGDAMDMVRHVVMDMNEVLMLWGPPGGGKTAPNFLLVSVWLQRKSDLDLSV